jgi:8-oxo-dGTP pyrophosphatase MutT (NUDIX family)
MTSQQPQPTTPDGFELAAGGLVWKCDDTGRRLAVVHRTTRKDWALPKGRREKNEAPETTALREAMEETHERASLERFAGSYSYFKEGQPKIILIWHMTHESVPYENPAREAEVDQVVWLFPEDAITRLSHQSEREFVARHCKDFLPPPADGAVLSDPKRIRLRAALHSCRERFSAPKSAGPRSPRTPGGPLAPAVRWRPPKRA